MDLTSSGFSVHGILQARILDWVAISPPGIEPESPVSPALAGGFFTASATWETVLSIIRHNEWAELALEENSSYVLRVLISRPSLKVNCIYAKMKVSVLIQFTLEMETHTHTQTQQLRLAHGHFLSIEERYLFLISSSLTLCHEIQE